MSQRTNEFVNRIQEMFTHIPNFTHSSGSITWLVFCAPVTTVNPICTPIANPRVVIEIAESCTSAHLEVHFKRVQSFSVEGNEIQLYGLIASLSNGSGYVLCSGIPTSVSCELSFESKSLRKWGTLFNRFDHKECLMWYKPSSGESGKTPSMNSCPKCTRLMYHLRDTLKKKKMTDPETKERRASAGSRYPKMYLTPESRAKRERNEKQKALSNKRLLKKLGKFDVDVSKMTSDDILAIVADIEKTSKSKLEQLLAEADIAGIA